MATWKRVFNKALGAYVVVDTDIEEVVTDVNVEDIQEFKHKDKQGPSKKVGEPDDSEDEGVNVGQAEMPADVQPEQVMPAQAGKDKIDDASKSLKDLLEKILQDLQEATKGDDQEGAQKQDADDNSGEGDSENDADSDKADGDDKDTDEQPNGDQESDKGGTNKSENDNKSESEDKKDEKKSSGGRNDLFDRWSVEAFEHFVYFVNKEEKDVHIQLAHSKHVPHLHPNINVKDIGALEQYFQDFKIITNSAFRKEMVDPLLDEAYLKV